MNAALFNLAKVPFFSDLGLFDFLSFGVIGLGLALGILAYKLLTQEQKKNTPADPLILSSVSRYMVFAFGICVLGVIVQLIPDMWPAKTETPQETDCKKYVQEHPGEFESMFKKSCPETKPQTIDCEKECPCPDSVVKCDCDLCATLKCPNIIKVEQDSSSGCMDKSSFCTGNRPPASDPRYANADLYEKDFISYCGGKVNRASECQRPTGNACKSQKGNIIGKKIDISVKNQMPFMVTEFETGEWIILEDFVDGEDVSVLICPRIDQERQGAEDENFMYANVIAGLPTTKPLCDSYYNDAHRIRKWTYKTFPILGGEMNIHVGLAVLNLEADVGRKFADVFIWP